MPTVNQSVSAVEFTLCIGDSDGIAACDFGSASLDSEMQSVNHRANTCIIVAEIEVGDPNLRLIDIVLLARC